MNKGTGFFNGRSRFVGLLLICIVILISIWLTDKNTEQETLLNGITTYDAEELLKQKTPYVGNNVKVVNIIHNLPYGECVKQVYLQTQSQPYGIKVDYDFTDEAKKIAFMKNDGYKLINNAAVIFSLIDNVEVVQFNVLNEKDAFSYNRDFIQKGFADDLREYSVEINTFKAFLQSLVFKVEAAPEKYALHMSSTPGIKMSVIYTGEAEIETVVYTTQKGSFLTWGSSNGKITEGGKRLEVPKEASVYWTPLSKTGSANTDKQDTIVTVALLDKDGENLAEAQVIIQNEDTVYYIVKPSLNLITK